jgi:hypothetical protein
LNLSYSDRNSNGLIAGVSLKNQVKIIKDSMGYGFRDVLK